MPIIKSAKKRTLQDEKRQERLRPYKTRMLTLVKNIKKWALEGNVEKIETHLDETYKAIDMAAKKNIIQDNNASRKKSLVQKTLSKLKGGETPVVAKTEVKKAPKAPKAAVTKTATAKSTTAKKAPAKKVTKKDSK